VRAGSVILASVIFASVIFGSVIFGWVVFGSGIKNLLRGSAERLQELATHGACGNISRKALVFSYCF
jgi:hypothetical protein